ncbi:hypothetical protein CGCTS75_v013380 [Colletotrichum tropicale]|nr:hypothetical protein CGCTS75_v013380 [Colletotrichum tropicale]
MECLFGTTLPSGIFLKIASSPTGVVAILGGKVQLYKADWKIFLLFLTNAGGMTNTNRSSEGVRRQLLMLILTTLRISDVGLLDECLVPCCPAKVATLLNGIGSLAATVSHIHSTGGLMRMEANLLGHDVSLGLDVPEGDADPLPDLVGPTSS